MKYLIEFKRFKKMNLPMQNIQSEANVLIWLDDAVKGNSNNDT